MTIQPHNQKAAATWGSGGTAYDKISETIADSIEHVLNLLDVRAGEKVLDLATGTGWTARRLAQKGASVTGVDIGEGVIAAARDLAEAAGPSIDFRVGDAEKVDLPDAAYDVITSSCGVIASRPEEALWGKTSDIWTFVGATIIVAAMTYIAHREARAGGRE
jgi:ubiquinone/menaquinone biosynthesis C-methylase UbiE